MASKKHKRPFRGTSKPRTFFDRELRQQGATQSLSVTKVVPDSWRRVRIEKVRETHNSVTVRITKLLDADDIAQAAAADKEREQYA